MADRMQVVRRAEMTAFSLRVMRLEDGYEYEIDDPAPNISEPEIAEVLFSVALDLKARQQASRS